jgi:hypothetical protein
MQILSSNISRLYRRIYIHQFLQQFFFLEILEYLIEERIYSDEVLLSVQYSVWQQYGDILARIFRSCNNSKVSCFWLQWSWGVSQQAYWWTWAIRKALTGNRKCSAGGLNAIRSEKSSSSSHIFRSWWEFSFLDMLDGGVPLQIRGFQTLLD